MHQHIAGASSSASSTEPSITRTTVPGPRASRRQVLRTAAWSVPAVGMVGAAPAYATSTQPATQTPQCASVGWESALFASIRFTNLTYDRRWTYGSTASIRLRLGRLVGDTATSTNDPALGFRSSTAGLTVSVTSYSFEVTLPYRVTFTTLPNGWTVSRVSGSRYRFTPSPSIVTPVLTPHSTSPDGSGPGVSIPASGLFTATIAGSNFAINQQVMNANYDFSPHYSSSYTTSGPDCAPRVQTTAWDTTLSVKPV